MDPFYAFINVTHSLLDIGKPNYLKYTLWDSDIKQESHSC
ncbi:hypothetical protein [Aeromonas phage Akh-2]|nr:hypothetical protein [Aeromonas phage Akh-2]